MHKIFVYGELTDPKTLEEVLGRVPDMTDDELPDYSITMHGEYQNIITDICSRAKGKLFEVNYEELKKLDEYEGSIYSRIGRKLASGTYANVYIAQHIPSPFAQPYCRINNKA